MVAKGAPSSCSATQFDSPQIHLLFQVPGVPPVKAKRSSHSWGCCCDWIILSLSRTLNTARMNAFFSESSFYQSDAFIHSLMCSFIHMFDERVLTAYRPSARSLSTGKGKQQCDCHANGPWS